MIFVNFKTYPQATGKEALSLAMIIERVVNETRVRVVLAVQAADIKEVSSAVQVDVWAQHIDNFAFGAHTGATLAEAVLADGAKGTFLNHSEKKFTDFEGLRSAHQRAREVGLKTLVFASDIVELEKVLILKPDFAAYEPPELVGSRDTSVAKAKPEVIAEAAVISKSYNIPLIVGAGIKSKLDVIKSLELGAVGVAVASDVVTAENPKLELMDLVGGFRS